MGGVIDMKGLFEAKVLIIIIGLLQSIKSGSITIIEAEKYMFTPRTANRLIDEGCSAKIVELLFECCELEDIESLIPDKFNSNVVDLMNRAEELLKSCHDFQNTDWREYEILGLLNVAGDKPASNNTDL